MLEALAGAGVRHLALATYANGYSQYVTTPEEYRMQHYEGASTLFGPATLDAYQGAFRGLAAALAGGGTAASVSAEGLPTVSDYEPPSKSTPSGERR